MSFSQGDGRLSPLEHKAMGIVLSIEGVLGIGASIFLLISLMDSRGRDAVHNAFRISLCLGDLAIGAMCPVVAIASFSHEWPYGSNWCQGYSFVAMFFGLISIWSLTALVIYRHQSSRFDSKKDHSLLSQRYTTVLAVIWGGALFWAAAPLPLIGWGRYTIEPFGTGCLLDFGDRSPGYFVYLAGFATFGLVIPMILLISRGLNYEKVPIESVIACWKAILCLGLYWGCYGLVAVATALTGPGSVPVRLFAVAPLLAKMCPIVNALLFGETSFPASGEVTTATKEQKKH